MNFDVIDENGKKINCKIVDLIKDESNNINYIVYTDGTKGETGKLKVYASRYINKDNNYILVDIENDYEWDFIDNYLASKDKR